MASIADLRQWLQEPAPDYMRDDPRYTGDYTTAYIRPSTTFFRKTIYKRDGRVCQYCGTTSAAHYSIDHIIPRSQHGANKPFNLVVACRPCNAYKRMKVWIPRNLDTITVDHPEHRARVLALAVPHE